MNRGLNYRQSLPGSTTSSMTPMTPMTRKRKRGPLETTPSSDVRFHEEAEVDGITGNIKSVIVIDDDTPEPPPTIASSSSSRPLSNGNNGHPRATNGTIHALRTRAQVAAAHAALNGISSVTSTVVPPPPKRRRRDHPQQAQPAAHGLSTRKPFPQITNKPWPSTSTDNVRIFTLLFSSLFRIFASRLSSPLSSLPYHHKPPRPPLHVMIKRVITLSLQTMLLESDVSAYLIRRRTCP
jgi:dual-specificity kinase